VVEQSDAYDRDCQHDGLHDARAMASDAFIDPEGYRAFIDTAEAEFRSGRTY
jgi:hypothetical protein